MRCAQANQNIANGQVFDRNIEILHLSKALLDRDRRVSIAHPITESFYNYGGDPVPTDSQSNHQPAPVYNFDSSFAQLDNSTTVTNCDENHDNDISDDLYVSAFGKDLSQPLIEAPSLPAVDNDEILKAVSFNLDDMTDKRDHLQDELTSALGELTDLRSIITKLTDENSATKTSLAREQSRAESTRLAAKQGETHATDTTNVIARARDLAEARANALRAAAEKRAAKAERESREMAQQRDHAKAALEMEKRRVAQWDKARRHRGVGVVTGTRDNLDALLQQMSEQRAKLDDADYSTLWREDVQRNIDLCLSVLYTCENEVVERGNTFVQRSCAAVSSTKDFIARRRSVLSTPR